MRSNKAEYSSLLLVGGSDGIDSYNCIMLQISSYFTDKLLMIVRGIVHHSKGSKRPQNDDEQVDQLAGGVLTGDSALEFIKHVSAAMALDQNVQHDVLV